MTSLLLSILLLAAPETAPEPSSPPPAQADPKATIREILKLTDEQAAEVLPLLDQVEAERTRRREARRESLRALRQDVEAGAATDVLERQLQAFEKAEATHRETVKDLLRKAEQPLTAQQRARLLLFLERSAEAGRDRPRPLRTRPPRPS